MTDLDAVAGFVEYLRAGGRSPGTIYVRRTYLERFARELPGGLLAATHDDLIAIVADPRLASETRRSIRATFRTFFEWALDEELVDRDPARRLPTSPTIVPMPRPVPEDVLADALAAADEETRLMLLLGAYAGLRRSEIARVHSDDVTVQGLRVIGKGGRHRIVPAHPLLADALAAWTGARGPGWVFPSPRFPGRPVVHSYVKDRLMAVLPAGYTPHKLRHRFATRAYRGSGDLFAVQRLLGHAKPETTMRYVALADDTLAAAVNSL